MAAINDVVLIHLEDTPISFARIESILPDARKDWSHIKLLMLQIPLQVVTWILKDAYINGDEFHMNGKKMRLEKIESPMDDLAVPNSETSRDVKNKDIAMSSKEDIRTDSAKIILFSDLKKNQGPQNS